MPSQHTNRGRKRAREARDELGLGRAPLPDLLEAVESAGAHVALLDLHGIAGAYLARDELPLIFVNGAEPLVRQRFTLAHELGHHWIGHGTIVDRPEAIFDDKDPLEIEANSFAAQFLLPDELVGAWDEQRGGGPITLDHVVELACAFGVSAQMARYRLDGAGVLTDAKVRERLDQEIAEDLHHSCYERLGLCEIDDELARAARALPRIPPAVRRSGFGELLAGELDVAGLAARSGQDAEALRDALAAFGLDELLPAAF